MKSRFTLTELVIVIAVTVILFAVSMPVLSQMQPAGRYTACLNNLKNHHTAITMYAQDNQGTAVYHMYRKFGAYGRWFHALDPYHPMVDWNLNPKGKSGVLLKSVACPEDALFNNTYNTTKNVTNGGDNPSYGLTSGISGKVLATLNNPAKLVIMADCGHLNEELAPNKRKNNQGSFYNWAGIGTAPRHGGGANIVHVDGHAVTTTKSEYEELIKMSNRKKFFNH